MKKSKVYCYSFLKFVCICLFLGRELYAQPLDVRKDSLLLLATHSNNDSSTADYYFQISRLYNFNNADSVMAYAGKILALSQAKNLKTAEACAKNAMGNAYFNRGNFTRSLECHLDAATILEKTYKKHPYLTGIYSQLVTAFAELNNYEKAEDFTKKSIASAEHWNDNEGLAMAYNNWGDLMDKQKKYTEALRLYEKTLTLSITHQLISMQAFAHFNLGYVYQLQGNFLLAKYHIPKALDISKKIEDTEGVIYAMEELVKLKIADNELVTAENYLDTTTHLLQQYPNQKLTKENYLLRSRIYEMKNQPDSALVYYKKATVLKDSLFDEFRQKLVYSLATNQEIQRLQQQASENEKALNNAQQHSQILLILGVLSLVSFISLMLFYLQRKNYYEKLEDKNQQIETQKEELSILNDTKDKLISILSHDLRVPLNQVKGLFHLLNSDLIGQEEFKLLGAKVKGQLDGIIENIENSLHWVASQLNGIVVKPEAVSVEQVVHQVVELYQSSLDAKDLCLTVKIPAHLFAQTDKEHLRLALRNLLANAIKFSHQGKDIHVLAEEKAQHICISVVDFGVGMSQQQVNQLMENSTHFTTLGTLKEKGTGLGLKLSKEFIEKSGGALQVKSEEGKGSEFTLVIPKAKVEMVPSLN